MDIADENALCEQWRRETIRLNTIVDEEYKEAQNHAYELGLKRGMEQSFKTCLWAKNERDLELMDTECGELHLINITNDKDFKFCPYCGRTINCLDEPYNKTESV